MYREMVSQLLKAQALLVLERMVRMQAMLTQREQVRTQLAQSDAQSPAALRTKDLPKRLQWSPPRRQHQCGASPSLAEPAP